MNPLFDQTVHVVQEEGYELIERSLIHYTFQEDKRKITYTFLPHLTQYMRECYPTCTFAAYVSNQFDEKSHEIEVVASYKGEDVLLSFFFPSRVEEQGPGIFVYGINFQDMFFAQSTLEQFANAHFFEKLLHHAMTYIEELSSYRLYFATGIDWVNRC